MTDKPAFDPDAIVDRYRMLMAQLESAPPQSRGQLQKKVQRLRERWTARQGEDSLHATAFGEPE